LDGLFHRDLAAKRSNVFILHFLQSLRVSAPLRESSLRIQDTALSRRGAEKLGVTLDDLLVSQPSFGEEALRICETHVRSNALHPIVLDSSCEKKSLRAM